MTQNIHDETEPTWRPDGRGLLYLHSEESRTSVRRVFTVSHATHSVADLAGVHASPDVGPDSDLVAFLWTGARDPWDVYVTRAHGRGEGDHAFAAGDYQSRLLVEPSHVRYPGAGGHECPLSSSCRTPKRSAARISAGGHQHPRRADRAAPAVVGSRTQVFANAGFVVLEPNLRGSIGYGQELAEGNRHDWGGKDLEDVAKGAQWLAKEARRCHAHRRVRRQLRRIHDAHGPRAAPDVSAAGVSVVGVVSWKTLVDTTRGDLREYLLRELGDPAKVRTYTASGRRSLMFRRSARRSSSSRARMTPRVPRNEANS